MELETPAVHVGSHSLTHPVSCSAWSHSRPLFAHSCTGKAQSSCGTFVISSAVVRPPVHLTSIFQKSVKTPALKITQFYVFHTVLHLLVLYIFTIVSMGSWRGREIEWIAKAIVFQCVYSPLIWNFSYNLQKKKNCLKNYFREFTSSDCTSCGYHISLLQFTAKPFKKLSTFLSPFTAILL